MTFFYRVRRLFFLVGRDPTRSVTGDRGCISSNFFSSCLILSHCFNVNLTLGMLDGRWDNVDCQLGARTLMTFNLPCCSVWKFIVSDSIPFIEFFTAKISTIYFVSGLKSINVMVVILPRTFWMDDWPALLVILISYESTGFLFACQLIWTVVSVMSSTTACLTRLGPAVVQDIKIVRGL